FFDSM
ncbi:hypothetical protein CISIN_1g0324792mg, partial [Citrus sinensis]